MSSSPWYSGPVAAPVTWPYYRHPVIVPRAAGTDFSVLSQLTRPLKGPGSLPLLLMILQKARGQ